MSPPAKGQANRCAGVRRLHAESASLSGEFGRADCHAPIIRLCLRLIITGLLLLGAER
jgi:hypothetical protein